MEGLFLKLVNMSISAGFIVLGILLIRLFMRKAPKWINVAVWCLVGIRLCLPFSFESELSVVPNTEQGIVSIAESLDKETVTKTETITETEDIIASQNSGEISQEVIGNPTVSPEPDVKAENETTQNAVVSTTPETVTTVVTETKNTENLKTIINIAILVWLAGIFAMLTYMIVSYAKIYFRIREGFAEGDRIILCDRISSPFVMGLVKPKIYLPSNLDGKYKEYVIAHERAHLKRRDYIWKLLAFFMLTVHWFNPLIWVAYTMLCRDIEFACDEKVIKIYGEVHKANYSEALLNCSVKRRVANINPLAFGEVSVKDRIINILNYKKPPIWITIIAVILIVCLTVGFMTDPVSEKKTDIKEKVETVVSDDEKENTSDTSSKPSTTDEDKDTESKPTESKPEDTSSEQDSKPEDTSSEYYPYIEGLDDFIVYDEYLYGENDIGDLSRETVKAIKDWYLKQLKANGDNSAKIENIKISKYYGTLSDGSIVVKLKRTGLLTLWFDIGNELPPVVFINDYMYYKNAEPLVFKNKKIEYLEAAYKKGIITSKVIDELFTKNNSLDVSGQYFNEKDNCTGLSKMDIYGIKRSYWYKLRRENEFSDLIISGYYGNLKGNKELIILSIEGSSADEVTEAIGGYTYTHLEKQGLYLYHRGETSSKYVPLLQDMNEAYISNTEIGADVWEGVFAYYPEYFSADGK